MKNKLTDFIQKTALEQVKGLGTAAKLNVAPPGQPALEGEIVSGDDVRVKEIMRVSVYDPERTGTVNDARLLDGSEPADFLDRANHTGTQTASTISDFTTQVQDLQTWQYRVKDTDQTKTADTTLANDSVLTKSIITGEVWRLHFRVLLEAANATMDYKFAISYSGTTTSIYCKGRYVAAGGTTETILSQNSIIGSTSVTAGTSGFAYIDIDVLIDAATDGTLGFQWAQDTSDAGVLKVLKGSYLAHTLVYSVPL